MSSIDIHMGAKCALASFRVYFNN